MSEVVNRVIQLFVAIKTEIKLHLKCNYRLLMVLILLKLCLCSR